jgi:hypothetical protein
VFGRITPGSRPNNPPADSSHLEMVEWVRPPLERPASCFERSPTNNEKSRFPTRGPSKDPLAMATVADVVEIPVAGMTCDHCVGTVRRALEAVPRSPLTLRRPTAPG